MQYVVKIKGSDISELTKDVPTLRLLLKAGVDDGFHSFTAAFLSGRVRRNALNLVMDTGAKIKDIILKPYGFDVTYLADNQLVDFWNLISESCSLIENIEYGG